MNEENVNGENADKENINRDKQLNRADKNKSVKLDQEIKK